MKIFGLMRFERRMNELNADSGDTGGGSDSADVGGGSDENSAYDDSGESLFPHDEDAFKQFGLNIGDYGPEAGEAPEPSKEEPQGSGEDEAGAGQKAQAGDEKSLIEFVNSLGAVHGESAIRIENGGQLKELIQKGHDYTQKTQALSEERKVLESEKVEVEKTLQASINEFNHSVQEHEKQLRESQQWSYALQRMQKTQPDLFAEFQAAYSEAGEQFDNPVINQQVSALSRRLEAAEKALTAREDNLIVGKFDSEKAALSATEQSWKELGITVDWTKAKERWAQTGLPVEEVVGSMYGLQVAKALESKSKVATVKAKVNARPTGAAGQSRSGGQKVTAIDPKLSHMDYARELLKRYQT